LWRLTIRILHLSDLHLAPIKDDEVSGDYKSDAVPRAERQRRVPALRRTLREFGERYAEELDAVVVSGDVTYAGADSGYKLLRETLEELGSALPADPGRVVVPPGNHDVIWQTKPSSVAHYQRFLHHVRDECGYRTPQLEGIDIAPGDGRRLRAGAVDPVLVGAGNTFLILALNSSNYCGVVEPTKLKDDEWEAALGALAPARGKAGAEDLRNLRVHDIARLSPGQLTAARRELNRARKELLAAGVDPATVPTIAVLHHHLLPVSTREEFKAFESISNLGEVRAFLRDNNVEIVLHGHKHERAVYWDYIPRSHVVLDEQPRRVLVVSGATIGAGAPEGDVVRLLEINGQPFGHRATISRYGAVAGGGALPEPTTTEATVAPSTPESAGDLPRIGPISGPTIGDVYARTISEFARLSKETFVENLVCEVGTSPEPGELPSDYPDIPNVDAAQRSEWVQQLVEWWQSPRTQLGRRLTFNHGGRIRRYQLELDQLARAEQALRQEAETSRAIITLIDPREDDVSHMEHKFPAFCVAQFMIRRSGADDRVWLDCTAYFRKQEFRWWWPINVAELAWLQRDLCARLEDKYDVEPGSIMTVAAIAKAGTAVPRVAVPLVDRLYDDAPGRLWLLAVAAAVPELPGREDLLMQWRRLVDDLEPQETMDSDGVPVAIEGLRTLIAALDELEASGTAKDLRDGLQRLEDKNEIFNARIEDTGRNPGRTHSAWRSAVQPILHDLRHAIDRLSES
jgi:hypothetical protein